MGNEYHLQLTVLLPVWGLKVHPKLCIILQADYSLDILHLWRQWIPALLVLTNLFGWILITGIIKNILETGNNLIVIILKFKTIFYEYIYVYITIFTGW